MFFWGGTAARAKGAGSIAARLNLMGVWCDSSQPGNEETDAFGRRIRVPEFETGC
jgi:hypothetical protein